MVRYYKDLLLTNCIEKARQELEKGGYVLLCLPLEGEEEICYPDPAEFPYCVTDADQVEENFLQHVLSRQKGEPVLILETNRTRIREISCEDLQELYQIYDEEEIKKQVEPLYTDFEEELAYTKDYIRYQYGFYDFGMWIIEEKQTGKVIGRAGFDILKDESSMPTFCEKRALEERKDFAMELGYILAKEYRRQGIATEVCQALMEYAKTYIPYGTIYAKCNYDNEASIKLLRKLGIIWET